MNVAYSFHAAGMKSIPGACHDETVQLTSDHTVLQLGDKVDVGC